MGFFLDIFWIFFDIFLDIFGHFLGHFLWNISHPKAPQSEFPKACVARAGIDQILLWNPREKTLLWSLNPPQNPLFSPKKSHLIPSRGGKNNSKILSAPSQKNPDFRPSQSGFFGAINSFIWIFILFFCIYSSFYLYLLISMGVYFFFLMCLLIFWRWLLIFGGIY